MGRALPSGSMFQAAATGAFLALSALGQVHAQTTWLGTTSSDWNEPTNWSSGTAAPTAADPVVFDSTSTNLLPSIANTGNAKSITVTNPSARIDVSLVNLNNTLNVAGGIDMSAATQDLRLGTDVTKGYVNLTQTGTVSVAAGRTLTFGGKYTAFNGGTAASYMIDGPGAVMASGTVSVNAPLTIRSGSYLSTLTHNITQPFTVNGGYASMNGDFNQNFIVGSSGKLASYTQTSGTSYFSRFRLSGTSFATISGGTAFLGALQIANSSNNNCTLTITGNASVSGTWGANFAAGSGAVANVILSGGTFRMDALNSSPNVSATRSIVFDGGVFGPAVSGTILRNMTSASVTNQGAIVNTFGLNAWIPQALTNGTAPGTAGPFTKLGSGTLTLSGSSTYSGPTTIAAGVVQAGNESALGTGTITFTGGGLAYTAASASQDWGGRIRNSTSPVSLNPSGQRATLTGIDGTNLAGLTIGGTGGTVALQGSNAYAGPTTVNGGTLEVDGVTTGTAAVTVNALATIAGTGTVGGATTITAAATIAPGAGPGTLAFAGALTWNPGANYNWQMLSGTGTAGGADSWDLVRTGGPLTIAATTADPFLLNLWTLAGTNPDSNGPAFNFDGSRNYSWKIASAAGGISGFAANKFRIATSATNGTGGFINDLAGGTFSVAQSGNDLNLVFTATGSPAITINVASGTQTQTAAGYPLLSGATPVTKTGAGTLVVDQANTLTGSTTVQGGRLQLAQSTALAASTVVPLAGGTLTLTRALQTAVGGLAVKAGGLTDVGNGMVTVAKWLAPADLVSAILTGMGDGTWNGTSGITSSVAAASGGDRTIGWLDNGDGSVTFGFAAPGDTNLDWMVDSLDQANFLAGGKLDSGQPATWNEGDFTYDGFVDILDAAAFTSTGLFDSGAYNPPPGAAGIAAVPEPASWAMLAVAAAAACRRRRRRAVRDVA